MNKPNIQELIEQLNDNQISSLQTIVMNYIRTNQILEDTTPVICPNCRQNHDFIKKGFQRGKQRYMCKCCNSKFTCNNNSISYYSHSSQDAWNTVILDTIAGVSIRNTAAKINRHPSTVFNMRHKFLLLLEDLIGRVELNEIIEIDETYVLESEKGNRRVKFRRPARKRGSKSELRGLSKDQVCICVATSRKNKILAKSVNNAKPTTENILEIFNGVVKKKSYICCDKLASYNKLIEECNCESSRMSTRSDYHSIFHLNTVNGLHSIFKSIYAFWKGVATKYINRYLNLFALQRFMSDWDENEMLEHILQCCKTIAFDADNKKVKSHGLLLLFAQ